MSEYEGKIHPGWLTPEGQKQLKEEYEFVDDAPAFRNALKMLTKPPDGFEEKPKCETCKGNGFIFDKNNAPKYGSPCPDCKK